MDENHVKFLLTPSFQCSTHQTIQSHSVQSENTENQRIPDSSIFMIVMTLSAPKNFEARNFIRSSIKKWRQSTSRTQGIEILINLPSQ